MHKYVSHCCREVYVYFPTDFLDFGQAEVSVHDGIAVGANGNVITLYFVDGFKGDDYLTANKTISDIVAPGLTVNSNDSGVPVDSSSGGGGGSGCFISTATN